MTAADVVSILLAATLAGSAAVLLAMALRKPLRAVFGARVAYAVWWIVPAMLVASLLPARGVMEFAPAVTVIADV